MSENERFVNRKAGKAPEKSNFAQACTLLGQFLKEKRNLGVVIGNAEIAKGNWFLTPIKKLREVNGLILSKLRPFFVCVNYQRNYRRRRRSDLRWRRRISLPTWGTKLKLRPLQYKTVPFQRRQWWNPPISFNSSRVLVLLLLLVPMLKMLISLI